MAIARVFTTIFTPFSEAPVREEFSSVCGDSADNLRQDLQNAIVRKNICGEVPELADGPDLGSGAAMRGGSNPPFPTWVYGIKNSCPLFRDFLRRKRHCIGQKHLVSGHIHFSYKASDERFPFGQLAFFEKIPEVFYTSCDGFHVRQLYPPLRYECRQGCLQYIPVHLQQ